MAILTGLCCDEILRAFEFPTPTQEEVTRYRANYHLRKRISSPSRYIGLGLGLGPAAGMLKWVSGPVPGAEIGNARLALRCPLSLLTRSGHSFKLQMWGMIRYHRLPGNAIQTSAPPLSYSRMGRRSPQTTAPFVLGVTCGVYRSPLVGNQTLRRQWLPEGARN